MTHSSTTFITLKIIIQHYQTKLTLTNTQHKSNRHSFLIFVIFTNKSLIKLRSNSDIIPPQLFIMLTSFYKRPTKIMKKCYLEPFSFED